MRIHPKYIPDATFKTMTPDGPISITSREVFAERNVILFGIPGAFTPVCQSIHLPGILAELDTFKSYGIDLVACTSVNDAYVLDIWARKIKAHDKILFLADGNADFACAMGLSVKDQELGLGLRSQRYSLWAKDGVINSLNIEPHFTMADVSSAHTLLEAFDRWFDN